MDSNGEVGHAPEGGRGNFTLDSVGGTTSVNYKGDTTKLGYITFDPGGVSTIDWSPTGVLVSESIRPP